VSLFTEERKQENEMKSHQFAVTAALILLSPVAFAQSHDHKATDKPAPTEAQKSFTQLKTLAGTWQASVTTDPPQKEMGDGAQAQVSLRVTSRGNALVHEMSEWGKFDETARTDHPVTMFYLDADRLLLTHYCDAGNRPRMVAKTSPDGKTVEFDFLDLSGSNQFGHMYHAVFTSIDANHHTEDWTWMAPGDKTIRAHMDLRRVETGTPIAAN
jgi:hypothetical protein